jgi:hypothetical protein
MTYPHEAEIRQWLENWGRWSPGGAAGGASQWRDAVDSTGYRSAAIPIMGGEAGDTQRALDRMAREERSALEQYHLRAGSMSSKAKRLRISTSTLKRRLHAAHHHFYEFRWAVRHGDRVTAETNAKLATEGRQVLQRKTADMGQVRLRARPPKPPEGSSR